MGWGKGNGDLWGPRGDPMRTPQGPMGTPCGPMETPWGPMGGAMGTHGDPMGTNGRAMGTQGDPWGPWGAKNRFHHDDNYTDPVEQHSHLTLLKPAEQTRLNVDQSKRDSNLRHLASVRDWMLEPKGVQSTTSSKPLLSNAASVRDWVLQGSLLETQSPAVGVGVTLSRSLCFFLRLVALWFLLFDLKLSGICNP